MSTWVTVLIENTYACGRETEFNEQVRLPDGGLVNQAFWDGVHELTGDGHPCGSREHAFYEVTIVEAPGRPDLIGQSYSWEG